MKDIPPELAEVVRAAREQIDRIDVELVRLLNERAAQVIRIGEVKRDLGRPIYQPAREEEIFGRIVAANEGPLEDIAVRRLFERILDEARHVERSAGKNEE